MTNTVINPDFENPQDSLEIKREIKRYLRYWPWFVGALMFCLLTSYIYLRYAPRIFETTAKIKILDESDGLELPTTAFIFKRSNINLENEIEILTSYRLLADVVRKLSLNTSFFEEGQIQTKQLHALPFMFEQLIAPDSINSSFYYEIEVNPNDITIYSSKSEKTIVFAGHSTYSIDHNFPFQCQISAEHLEELVDRKFIVSFNELKLQALSLKNSIEVEEIGDLSDLLELTYRSESSKLSEMILDTLVDTFDKDGINDRQLVSKRTLTFIDDRFVYLATELDSIEIDRKEFKQTNNIVDLAVDADLVLQQRTVSDAEVFKIENQIALANLLKEVLSDSTESASLLPANIGLESADVNDLIAEYNANILEREKLITSAGTNNPNVNLINSRLTELKRNLDLSLDGYNRQLAVSQAQLQRRNEKFTGQVAQIPEKEKLLRAIERQQAIKESLYLLLLQKREEAAINLAITEPSVKIVEYALSGSIPISPKSTIIYAAAFLGGLLLPFGVLYMIFLLDTKIHTKEDLLELKSDLAVLGEIPAIKSKNEIIFNDPNDRSTLAESFRILSANVSFMLANNSNGHVIYCTSTIKGEGKTYISVNLSLALSSLNKRVLLIGADLRNPQIHNHINFDKNQNGLTNYMHDYSIEWKDLIIKGFEKHDKHDTIISGAIPPNPAHLLTNGRFEQLIEEAKSEYDYIIVDTAPTILVTDTMLISKFADATIYILRANFTDKTLLSFSKDLHDSKKLKNMAYVLNGVGASKSYGYKYNYGYGYGYGSQE